MSVTSPANGSTVSGNVTIAASASDNVRVVQVQFFVDGVLLATDTSSPYSATWSSKQASKGQHSIYAAASDAAGNSTKSATIAVTV